MKPRKKNPEKNPEKKAKRIIYFRKKLISQNLIFRKEWELPARNAVWFRRMPQQMVNFKKTFSFIDLRTVLRGQNENLIYRPRLKHILIYSLNVNQHEIFPLESINNSWYCSARPQSQIIWALSPSHLHQWWDAVSISSSPLGVLSRWFLFLG